MPYAIIRRWRAAMHIVTGIVQDRRAVTAVEYALVALLIIIAIAGGVRSIGPALTTTFNNVSSEL